MPPRWAVPSRSSASVPKSSQPIKSHICNRIPSETKRSCLPVSIQTPYRSPSSSELWLSDTSPTWLMPSGLVKASLPGPRQIWLAEFYLQTNCNIHISLMHLQAVSSYPLSRASLQEYECLLAFTIHQIQVWKNQAWTLASLKICHAFYGVLVLYISFWDGLFSWPVRCRDLLRDRGAQNEDS